MEEAPTSCANCGKAEEFEATLKACAACKLVKYCGRDCQIAHRPQHKKECRKRADELHDEELFKQPPKPDDCPICFLILPSMNSGRTFMICCGKMICAGCSHEHDLQNNGCIHPTCPFCRANLPIADECIKQLQKRVDSNDPNTTFHFGTYYLRGNKELNLKKDVGKAIELLHRSAELGSAGAYCDLGRIYDKGDGVSKDEAKARQYFEKGAIAGDVTARFNLGTYEFNARKFDRAIKHWLIASSFGDIRAVSSIKRATLVGIATRDHYAQALQQYQEYLDEVKSDQRDKAAAYADNYKYLIEEMR